MAKKFSELRDKMSPESKKKAEAKAKDLLRIENAPRRLFLVVESTGKRLALKVGEGTREVSMDEALNAVGFKEGEELVLFRAKHYDRIAELAWRYKDDS